MGRSPGLCRPSLIGVRENSYPDLIRTTTSVRLTDLIDQGSGKATDAIPPASVIVSRRNHTSISRDVDAAAVSWSPAQTDKPFALLSVYLRAESNVPAPIAGVRTDQPVARDSEIVEAAAILPAKRRKFAGVWILNRPRRPRASARRA